MHRIRAKLHPRSQMILLGRHGRSEVYRIKRRGAQAADHRHQIRPRQGTVGFQIAGFLAQGCAQRVTILGAQGADRITVREFCAWADCIPWEALCTLTQRVQRVYRTDRT